MTREGQTLRVRFRDAATRDQAREALLANMPDLAIAEREDGQDLLLVATLKPEAHKRNQEYALKQNITTLHNRINELGVAEPMIQQQGADRIVVQLPGVQDMARAKSIIGRTATLEMRMVAEEHMNPEALAAGGARPAAVRHRVLRRAQRPAAARAAPGRAHWRSPHRRAAGLRQPDQRARGAPAPRWPRAGASSRK